MKKTALLIPAIIFSLAASCSLFDSLFGTDDSGENQQKPVNYAAEFRGEWIRMDTGDRWYINGSSIKVNGADSFPRVTLTKTSENVAVATDANKEKYTLFAARTANANFSAQIVLLDDNAAGQKPPVKITNPRQPDLPLLVVQPNPQTGDIYVQNQIPGDPIVIVPDSSEWKDIKVDLTPGFGKEQNLGVIPLTRGDNFKVSVQMGDAADDITELYADLVPRDYIFELENIGAANCGDAGWTLSWDDNDFLYISGGTEEDFTNIVPGEKKQLTLRLASKPITAETKSKEIKINIWNYDSKSKKLREWEDTVSISFYNTPVPFRFSSEKQVQGIIKASKGKSYYFRTERQGEAGDYAAEMYVPWSREAYTVAFLGATIESNSATKYSFAIDAQPPVNWASVDMWAFLEKYKPANEDENTAPVIDLTTGEKSFMGYLASDSVDYYRVRLADSPPAPDLYTVTFNANGATSGTAPAAVTWGYGTTIQLPGQGDMVKLGYEFDGWSTDSSGAGNKYISSYTVTGNVTLYVRWNPIYTITFDGNGATSGTALASMTGVSGTVIQLPDQGAMEKFGYLLDCWSTNSSGTGTNYSAGSSYIITDNATLYVQWAVSYTVTFDKNNADAGSTEANPHITTIISTVGTLPQSPTRPDYIFYGWNTAAGGRGTVFTGATVVTENITVYAQWIGSVNVPGATLAEKLNWLQTNAASNRAYIIEVTADESIAPTTLSYSGKTNVTICLRGDTVMRSISLSANGSLFTVGSGVTLIMDNNITLCGLSDNNASLVLVNSGTLEMREGSLITGNTASYGSGVRVSGGGTFTMNGGKISGNTAGNNGGGVYVSGGGTFTMNGGKISGNTAGYGGGVYVDGGTFTMIGGEISDNTASDIGGGVYNYGTFTMSGGVISSNTASSYGGGVSVGFLFRPSFTMNGGKISGNTANSGGGVYMLGGTFTMNGGEISGNTAFTNGGGVFVSYTSNFNPPSGTFTKTGGTIYGYTSGNANSNTVKDSNVVQSNMGHTVYFNGRRRETTAGPTVNLDSRVEGAAGGWE